MRQREERKVVKIDRRPWGTPGANVSHKVFSNLIIMSKGGRPHHILGWRTGVKGLALFLATGHLARNLQGRMTDGAVGAV